jgi:hypothetical protein
MVNGLQAYGHRSDVDFDQQIVWQVGHHVSQQQRVSIPFPFAFLNQVSRKLVANALSVC